MPDCRITCIFVDKRHRRQGYASRGAVSLTDWARVPRFNDPLAGTFAAASNTPMDPARVWWEHVGMPVVVRLVTVVDIDERNFPIPLIGEPVADGPIPEGVEPAVAPPIKRPEPDYDSNMGFSALHMAVLDDGRRVTLLDDRGWGGHGPPGIWGQTSVEEIEQDARMVVGPHSDDPEEEAWHWAHLADLLREQGVLADSGHLSRLPHDVELSEQVRARIASA